MARKAVASNTADGPCKPVGKGGVGESGASSQVVHQVTATISKLMVLRTVETSLCPNTGAAAMLLVNGKLEAAGTITEVGESIQAEAGQGDRVVGIVHTVPLFNDIVCKRLGELSYRLDECDLVTTTGGAATTSAVTGSVVSCSGVETRDWYAWVNLMPPPPDELHVVGEVLVPNPGVQPLLFPRRPPAKSKKVLQLDLVLIQLPGIWPQVLTWKPVRYDKILLGKAPNTVEIFCGDEKVQSIEVQETH